MDASCLTNVLLMALPILGLALAPGAGDGAGAGEGGDGAGGGDGGDGGNAGGDGQGEGAGTETKTPGIQAGGFKVPLTDEQRKRLLEGGELELTEDQYTSGVRGQMDGLRKKAAAAEERAKVLENERKTTERKQLEEQKRFKELYENEKGERKKEVAARLDLTVRTSFVAAAAKAGIVDPDDAFVLARAMPEFAGLAVGDTGAVTGVDELVKQIVESKPYLVGKTKSPGVGSATNPRKTEGESKPAETQAEADARIRQRVRESA